MLMPFMLLGGILTVITAPGLIAQRIERRKVKQEQNEQAEAQN